METPGKKLIEELEQLRNKLNKSGVERTVGLGEAMGKDCTYYRKSMDRFIREDYEEVRDIIHSLHSLLEIIEP